MIFNDLEPSPLTLLKTALDTLPKALKNRCEVVEENCLRLLEKKPELHGRINLILCRNLLHCINKQDREKFFLVISNLLAPGGKAIFTTNSVYNIAEGNSETLEKYRGRTFMNEVVVKCGNHLTTQYSCLFHDIAPVDEPPMNKGLETSALYLRDLYSRDNCESNWEKINPVFKARIKKACEYSIQMAETAPVFVGGIKLISAYTRCYDFQSITDLFEKHAFTVQATFLVNDKGTCGA